MTLCPGFRDGRVDPIKVAEMNANSTAVDSLSILSRDKVKEMSYDRKEFITFFTQARS